MFCNIIKKIVTNYYYLILQILNSIVNLKKNSKKYNKIYFEITKYSKTNLKHCDIVDPN